MQTQKKLKDKFKLKISKSIFVHECKGQIKSKYRVLENIGKGTYGQVKKVLHKATGELRAMKIIKKGQVNDEFMSILMNEIEILKQLDHPKIVRIFEFYQDRENFFLITELIQDGDLSNLVKKQKKFDEKQTITIIKQLLLAIVYCHTKKIAHRDLKPENLILEDKEKLQVKLIDFGTSIRFDLNKMDYRIGTPHYMAPEVITKAYDEKCDIWSIGVIAYYLLAGIHPFRGKNQNDIFKEIKEYKLSFGGQEWREISTEAKLFIKRLMSLNPKDRPRPEEALLDQWIMNGESSYPKKKQVIERNNLVISKMIRNTNQIKIEKKLQQAILSYFANYMNSDENKRIIEEIYFAFDSNNDGIIDQKELELALLAHYDGNSDLAHIKTMEFLEKLDLNENGDIEYSEFMITSIESQQIMHGDIIQEMFEVFDLNQSGEISSVELRKVLGNNLRKGEIEDNEWDEIVNEIDSNGNGYITFEDFKTTIMNLFKRDDPRSKLSRLVDFQDVSQAKAGINRQLTANDKVNPDFNIIEQHHDPNGNIVDTFLEAKIDISRLDDIFSFTYSFDKLQAILKVLIQQQRAHSDHINSLYKQTALMDKFRQDQKQIKDNIKSLGEKLNNHDDSLFNINNNVSNIKINLDDTSTSLENTKRDQDNQLERIEKLENDQILMKDDYETNIQGVKEELVSVKDNYLSKKQHEEKNQEMKKELSNDIKSNEDELKKLQTRVKELENSVPTMRIDVDANITQIKDMMEKIGQIDTSVDKHRSDISLHTRNLDDNMGLIKELQRKLQEKVGCDIFDKEINYLKSLLTHLRNKQQDDQKFMQEEKTKNTREIGSKEFNLLREIEEKLPMIEDKLKQLMDAMLKIPRIEDFLLKLSSQLKELNVSEIMQKLKELQEHKLDKDQFEKFVHQFLDLEAKMKDLQKMISILDQKGAGPDNSDGIMSLIQKQELLIKKISDLEKEVVELKRNSKAGNTISINEPANSQEINDLKEQIYNMKKEMDLMKQGFGKSIKDLEKQVKFKVDNNQLNQLEKVLMDQLNEQMNILNNKIDDLKKLKAQIAKLEAALKKLQDYIMEQLALLQSMNHGNSNGEEEDAMFSKRPLLGYSCASCDKDILNLSGRPADFHPWSKMPQRDPTDRISRVGQGFSRMLQQVKPEMIDKLKRGKMMNQTMQNFLQTEGSVDETMNEDQSIEAANRSGLIKPISSQSQQRLGKIQNKTQLGKTQPINSKQIGANPGSQTERSHPNDHLKLFSDTPQFKKNLIKNIQHEQKLMSEIVSPLRERASKIQFNERQLEMSNTNGDIQYSTSDIQVLTQHPTSKSTSKLPPVLRSKTPQKKQ
ncbi:protein kinase domain containing protein [Stylonychia lemnae]|uniref:non-specific serine/threonine protein kinase n=1 Tax=Stylonychia lemnae TaxID=5949 RepID=A0A078AY37_STYLE|nr:protein kinase domain containing protein [Stylonychia lemnae]|eukprot:CDW86127.1 protein kinase domain containing protein [Stylonychia lemnae]